MFTQILYISAISVQFHCFYHSGPPPSDQYLWSASSSRMNHGDNYKKQKQYIYNIILLVLIIELYTLSHLQNNPLANNHTHYQSGSKSAAIENTKKGIIYIYLQVCEVTKEKSKYGRYIFTLCVVTKLSTVGVHVFSGKECIIVNNRS